jgi:hypothetical protein
MDSELIAYLDERFQEVSRQTDGLRDEIAKRLDWIESSVCQTQAAVEDLRNDLHSMAHALIAVNGQVDSFRADVAWQFYDARVVIRRFQWELERRVRPLESWKEREGRDPIAVLRERLANGTLGAG